MEAINLKNCDAKESFLNSINTFRVTSMRALFLKLFLELIISTSNNDDQVNY